MYVALSSGRSLQGNQVGAPCGWPATITPSVSSSQPASPTVLLFITVGRPEYLTLTSNVVPVVIGVASQTAMPPSRWV